MANTPKLIDHNPDKAESPAEPKQILIDDVVMLRATVGEKDALIAYWKNRALVLEQQIFNAGKNGKVN